MSLVYLVTSLPKLKYASPPPFDTAAFFQKTENLLNDAQQKDIDLLKYLEVLEESSRIYSKMEIAGMTGSDQIRAALLAERNDTVPEVSVEDFPAWLFEPNPKHILMRSWYEELYKGAKSQLLRLYGRYFLNMDEAFCGLLAKKQGVSSEGLLEVFEGSFDSTALRIRKNFDSEDLGLSNVFSWFKSAQAVFAIADPLKREETYCELSWKLIQELKPLEVFSIDYVIAFYFELRILMRLSAFSQAKGEKIFNSILENSCKEAYVAS